MAGECLEITTFVRTQIQSQDPGAIQQTKSKDGITVQSENVIIVTKVSEKNQFFPGRSNRFK